MRQYRYIIFLFISITTVLSAYTQQHLSYYFRRITHADGLLHNQVFGITQDKKGFLWIATTNGLQRYDGSRFFWYPDFLCNPYDEVTYRSGVYADQEKDLLWIQKNNKIETLDLKNNIFKITDLIKTQEQLAKETSPAARIPLLPDNHTMYVFDTSIQKYMPYNTSVMPANAHQSSLIAADSSSGYSWTLITRSLYVFDRHGRPVAWSGFNPIHHPLLDKNLFGIGEKIPHQILIDSKKNIWISTWGDELYQYHAATNQVRQYSIKAIKQIEDGGRTVTDLPQVNCMLEDNHHVIWIGTLKAGLLRYNPDKDNFDYSLINESNPAGNLREYNIYSLSQDREENIWISTDNGICMFNPYQQYFSFTHHEENNPASILKNEIQCVYQAPNGDIFLGTWGGGFAVYDSHFNFKKNVSYTGNPEINFVWSFAPNGPDNIWLGSQHGWLTNYNILTGQMETVHPPELENSTIRCIATDQDGNLYMGLHNGKTIVRQKKNGKFIPFRPGVHDDPLLTSPVINIFIDRENKCWVSTETGLKEFDAAAAGYVNNWQPDSTNPKSIAGKTCHGIEEYNDSILLVGTIYGGLNFFNKHTKSFTHMGIADGLPSGTVYAVKKDATGNIWLTTEYNLCRLNLTDHTVSTYSLENGSINASITSGILYPLQNGDWVTFTNAEAIRFTPEKLSAIRPFLSKVEITSFKIYNKPVVVDSLLSAGLPIRLTYKQNFFTIEFSSLSYSELQPTRFFYRLSDIDGDWVNGGSNRLANYTDLKPGEYLFEVKAENGGNSSPVTSFRIIIKPPYWQTTWYKAAWIMVIAGLVYAFTKWRIKSIRKEEKSKRKFTRELANMEMKALRSQMNPHFIFNCINSIDALIQSNDKYHATVYLNKFAKLIRNILDSSKQNTISLNQDLEALKLYIELEQLRHENKFTASVTAEESVLQEDYKVPPLIIQPFVENAIIHGIRHRPGNGGILTITVSRQGEYLQYLIEDNGVGRDYVKSRIRRENQSYGMDMSNDRVKLFNNEATASVHITDLFNNGQPAGTRVEVLLKIQSC
ncbi:MAG: histidine kinase [Chitinophagaceae bacterium]|nr:histidine kinase [Chitinophagaceae bacterium]